MMGLQGSGGYNDDDVNATRQFKTVKEKKEFNIKEIKKRLSDYGFLGYMKFLLTKYRSNVTDGSFFFGREGGKLSFPEVEMNSSNKLIYFLKELYYGKYVPLLRFCAQVIWVFMLFLSLVSHGRKGWYLMFLRLALIGGLLFLLIFEGGRSRYMIQFSPCIVVMGAVGCGLIMEKFATVFRSSGRFVETKR
jgi:hypothetical protein